MDLPAITRPREALDQARLLLDWFEQLSTFQDATAWDVLAQRVVAHLQHFQQDGTRRQIDAERELAGLNQFDRDRQQMGKLAGSTPVQRAEAQAKIEHIKTLREELAEASQALQVRIDLTPCDALQQQQIAGELLHVRDQIEQHRRENLKGINLARRQMNANKPDEPQPETAPAIGKRMGADLRRAVHFSQVTQLAIEEREQEAIEQQLAQVDRWLSWVRRIK
jgi:hypothetical protein